VLNIQDLIARLQQQQYPPRAFPSAPLQQQQMQVPTAGNHMVQQGPYGNQAQQLSGLLGQQPQPQAPGQYGAQAQQLSGLLGGPRAMPMAPPYRPGLFMPGFRPGIDTPAYNSGSSQGSPRRRVQPY
jgi:hypothetical protein